MEIVSYSALLSSYFLLQGKPLILSSYGNYSSYLAITFMAVGTAISFMHFNPSASCAANL